MKTFEVFVIESGKVCQSYNCDYFTGQHGSVFKFWIKPEKKRWFQDDELVGVFPGSYSNIAVREKQK